MIVAFRIGIISVVQNAQAIHRAEHFIALAFFQLAHVGFAGVKKHALEKRVGPSHLHFHDELAAGRILAAHVHDAVFDQRNVWHLLAGKVFKRDNELAFVLEGQHPIEKLTKNLRVLTENPFEHNVAAGIEKACHSATGYLPALHLSTRRKADQGRTPT